MNYAILRTAKLSTNAAVASLMSHSFRNEHGGDKPHNADPALSSQNTLIGHDSHKEAYQAYIDHLPEKVRKNGVRCVEYLIAASPDVMQGKSKESQNDYMDDALKWLKEKHGAENIIGAAIHRDETTPHMHVFVVPYSQEKDDQGKLKKPGKLNAREFLGGVAKLNKIQTDFAKEVGEKHGLKRGVEKSRATHETVKEYYERANKGASLPQIETSEFEPIELTKGGMFKSSIYEGGHHIKERVMGKFNDEFQNLGAMFNEANAKAKKARSSQAKAEKALSRMKEDFKGMESYPKMNKEEKQAMQETVKRLRGVRLYREAMERVKMASEPKKREERER